MLIVSAVAYGQLPERVPTHWNAQGVVDGYSPRTLAVLLMPGLAAVIVLLMRTLPAIDPLTRNVNNAAIMRRYSNWLALFLLALHVLMLAVGIGAQLDFVRFMTGAMGVLIAVIGNEMGRLRRNSWAGIRLPWTIANEDVWRVSNRVGGRLFVISGVLSVLAAVVLPTTIMFIAVLVLIGLATVAMVVYSFLIARRSSNHPVA